MESWLPVLYLKYLHGSKDASISEINLSSNEVAVLLEQRNYEAPMVR